MHVLLEQPRSEALQQFYEIHWRPLPNLAMDLAVPLLARIMPLEWAGKVFVSVVLILLPAGTALVHRAAAGQWSVWPLFGFVFLYNHLLVWGFLNYLCGLGLAFLAFALWLALAEHALVMRVAAASVSAVLLYFAHLAACAVFAVLILGHELGRLWGTRDFSKRRIAAGLIAVGLPFAVPLALLMQSALGRAFGDIGYGGILRKLVLLGIFEGHPVLTLVTRIVLLILIAAGFLSRTVVVAPALRGPLLFLAVAYCLAPARFMMAWGIDERLPLVLVLMLAAGTISTGLRARWVCTAALAVLALALARVDVSDADFQRAERLYARLLPLMESLPQGGRVAVAFGSNEIGPGGVPINHLPTLAVIRRDAFVPTLFASGAQQPITLTPLARKLRDAAEPEDLWRSLMAGEAGAQDVRTALAGFDWLVVLDPRPFAVPANPQLVPMGREPNFAFFRVLH